MQANTPILKLDNINKWFGNVHVLRDVDFGLLSGEIHAVLGENGAGKSTLIKVLTGAYTLDQGSITHNGKKITPSSPAQAQSLGISTVYQEVNLLPNLSVAHNLFLGREPRQLGCINWKKLNRNAGRLIRKFDLDIDVTRPLSDYSVAVRQLIAITRGVDCSANVLILDEPTASLDNREVDLLFRILKGLKQQGIAIIFISHFLDQVYAIADRITVLRNGVRIGTFETETLPRQQLIAHMLGRELQEMEHAIYTEDGGPQLESALLVEELGADNGLHDVSFSVRPGQALGLAGLLGSGRTELCNTLFGISHRTAGTISVYGSETDISKPSDAINGGLAMCPEDRKVEGIIGPLSIRENIVIALQTRRGWWKRITPAQQNSLAGELIAELNIVCADAEDPVESLSGGNQQKVLLARCLCTGAKILILDEPTRGIDIGAHADIIKLIRQLCRDGRTVVVASSEVEELVAFSDRVLVMRDLTNVLELQEDEITEQAIVAAVASSHDPQSLTV